MRWSLLMLFICSPGGTVHSETQGRECRTFGVGSQPSRLRYLFATPFPLLLLPLHTAAIILTAVPCRRCDPFLRLVSKTQYNKLID